MTFKDEKSSEISSCVCSRTFKEEFRLRNLTLKHNKAKSFVTSEVGLAVMMRKYSVPSLVFFLFDNEFYRWFQNEKHKIIMLLRQSTLKGQSDLKVYLKLLQFSMDTGVCKSL